MGGGGSRYLHSDVKCLETIYDGKFSQVHLIRSSTLNVRKAVLKIFNRKDYN